MSIKKEEIPLSELLPVILATFEMGGEFRLYPKGVSMRPTLVEGRDSIMLSAPIEQIHVGDILLYRRESGAFVLHRVVKIARDGSLTFRGDNQYESEPGISPTAVIAVVKRYFHGDREVRCDALGTRFRLFLRRFFYPIRFLYFRGRAALVRFIRRKKA